MSTHTQRPATQPDAKAPASTSMTPTVTFNHGIITIEVLVAQSKGASAPTISVPIVTIPYSGTWTLVWDLRVLTPWIKAHFADTGVVLPKTLPPGTTSLTRPTGIAAQWTVRLENEVRMVSSFQYEIVIKSSAGTQEERAQIDLRNDSRPVEVTKVPDPVDPPISHLL